MASSRRVDVEVSFDADGNLDLEIYGKHCKLMFIYSETATKFCEISTAYLTGTTKDKSQNFEAFSEYMNFTIIPLLHWHYNSCIQN